VVGSDNPDLDIGATFRQAKAMMSAGQPFVPVRLTIWKTAISKGREVFQDSVQPSDLQLVNGIEADARVSPPLVPAPFGLVERLYPLPQAPADSALVPANIQAMEHCTFVGVPDEDVHAEVEVRVITDVPIRNLCWLAQTLLLEGRPADALRCSQVIVRLYDEDPRGWGWDLEARSLMLLGYPEKAAECWRRALELDPSNNAFRTSLARASGAATGPLPSAGPTK
jgi:tetratricopeptide (TPR) repeat protein